MEYGDGIARGVPGAQPVKSDPNSTIRGAYGLDNRCRACGEHLAEPHAPQCPLGVAAGLREEADSNDEDHAATLAAGGYTSGACTSMSEGDEPAEVSHAFLAITQRVGADLIAMDQQEAIDLGQWPAAAQLVAYLTGKADQWRA